MTDPRGKVVRIEVVFEDGKGLRVTGDDANVMWNRILSNDAIAYAHGQTEPWPAVENFEADAKRGGEIGSGLAPSEVEP